jgi:hypothetical protein
LALSPHILHPAWVEESIYDDNLSAKELTMANALHLHLHCTQTCDPFIFFFLLLLL